MSHWYNPGLAGQPVSGSGRREMAPRDRVRIEDTVAAALRDGQPVVALETAVATHGLPEPVNIEIMGVMMREIEDAGAVPAVCLVNDGTLTIGAPMALVVRTAGDQRREKASVRDLGSVLARGVPAGLTVSATLYAASLAGIRVFATGGIGGVHTDVRDSLDISADLHQLVRSRVITVCAGAKSVLDIPRTLEYLETLGVPVFGYRTDEFPAFYLPSSCIPVPPLDSPASAAEVAQIQWELGYEGGLVIGNPLPPEEALHPSEWEGWLRRATREAREEGIRGKLVTPFLLARVAEFSDGETVRANLALLRHNARLAAEIGIALAG